MVNTILEKANPDSFKLAFPTIPYRQSINETSEFTLNIFGTFIPGLSLNESEQNFQGFGSPFPTQPITYDPWTVNFVVDAEFKNWQILYKWIMYINNNLDKGNELPTNCMIDASLVIMRPYNQKVLEVKFKNVWPQNLAEVTFSTRDSETILESSVTFRYTRYEI